MGLRLIAYANFYYLQLFVNFTRTVSLFRQILM